MRIESAIFASTLMFAATPSLAWVTVGDTVQVQYLFPDVDTVVFTNTATFTHAEMTLSTQYAGLAWFYADKVRLEFAPAAPFVVAPFNGVKITDLSNPTAFTGWIFEGPPAGVGSFADGSILLNLSGQDDQGIVVRSPVPEPMTWNLMVIGFTLLGAVSRLRRTAKSACAIGGYSARRY